MLCSVIHAFEQTPTEDKLVRDLHQISKKLFESKLIESGNELKRVCEAVNPTSEYCLTFHQRENEILRLTERTQELEEKCIKAATIQASSLHQTRSCF